MKKYSIKLSSKKFDLLIFALNDAISMNEVIFDDLPTMKMCHESAKKYKKLLDYISRQKEEM